MWGGGFRLGLVVAAVAVTLSGCGFLRGGGLESMGCTNMPDGACQEQGDRIAARHPGATVIDLTCRVAVCDRAGGSGTAVVTMPDGATVNDTFSYVGDPAPMPAPTCVGLAIDVCRTAATGKFNETAPAKRVVAISITCISATCTDTKGEADTSLVFADGSTSEGAFGWDGGGTFSR